VDGYPICVAFVKMMVMVVMMMVIVLATTIFPTRVSSGTTNELDSSIDKIVL